MPTTITFHTATMADCSTITELIAESARGLGKPDYSDDEIDLALQRCEAEARQAGFRSLALGATLPGQRLYAAHGFVAGAPIDHDIGEGRSMAVIPMTKKLDG